jgi:hypothetical protein
MALSEHTLFEPSAAELINLQNILKICTDRCSIPDVGPFTIRPDLSIEHHYTFALDRFEKTARVFEDGYYGEEVLSIVMSEDKLDEKIADEAKEKGVPEQHFPQKRRRIKAVQEPLALVNAARDPLSVPSHKRKHSTPFALPYRPFHNSQAPATQPSRKSVSTQPSLAALSSSAESTTTDKESSCLPPYSGFSMPKTQSVISFMSSSSQSSWHQQRKHRRRDSLLQFFRRDPGWGRNTPSAMSQVPMCATPSIAEVPELSSPQSHQSQDLSSLQSLDLSRRTSSSSFGEQRPLPTFERHQIEALSKTVQFQKLQRQCGDKMLCFSDFAQHQRVALPLILGRNRLWLEDRKKTKLEGLRKQVSSC